MKSSPHSILSGGLLSVENFEVSKTLRHVLSMQDLQDAFYTKTAFWRVLIHARHTGAPLSIADLLEVFY